MPGDGWAFPEIDNSTSGVSSDKKANYDAEERYSNLVVRRPHDK
jgi:hypothetical protein